MGQVTGLTLLQRRAVAVTIRHERTGRPGKGPILDGSEDRAASHYPREALGLASTPKVVHAGIALRGGSGCCTGIVPDGGGRCQRQIHGLPEKFLTTTTIIITISKAGPVASPAG